MYSLIVQYFTKIVEFGNRYLTLGGLLFRKSERIFAEVEMMLLFMILFCIGILFSIHKLPFAVGMVISFLLLQRIMEYLIVYSRNFMLGRGRVFTHFEDATERSLWLMLMFFLNILQALIVFSIWYRFLSFHFPDAFSKSLGILDSFYFSVVTFLTVGFGDIVPLTAFAKTLVIFEGLFIFYTIVIVINGLISIHFKK